MSANLLDSLTPNQQAGIIALLNEPTVKRAADSIGVDERTVHRWLDEPNFSRAYSRARRQGFSQAISLVQKYAPMAVQNLAKIANDVKAPPAARVSASTALLKFSRESLELDDLAQRLDAVEQAVKNDTK
jgi:hypothetical protein